MATQPQVVEEVSDGSLVRRYRDGCQDSATELYARYAQRLLALVRANRSVVLAGRVDPEDIVQSVFRNFFQAARRGSYEVPRGEELWRIFLVIALNKLRNQKAHHRAAKRDARLTSTGPAFDRSMADLQEAGAAQYLLEVVVRDALETLDPQHREMVEMRIEGFEVSQIAEATHRSKRTVERVLQECRKHLHAIFHDVS